MIQASPLLTLKAIYSRSQISAENFIAAASSNAEAYFDSPSIPSKSLDSLLQRDDIAAVIVCVAINVSPEVIKKALHAGKHVLSEKPIAPDLKNCSELDRFLSTRDQRCLLGCG